ncbi:MAG TPA: NUDIX domain-containing protein [Bdellovibrio sp.]|uniref:NUDIX domain-containing protein n=1 Tax=Bdellovibrio sp. TaxID=28201 RepID=UPI002EF4B557
MSEGHRFSAGIIPFLHTDPNYVLILRSYNYWDFPKGEVEKSEDFLAAAKRELFEETGIQEVSFPLGIDFIETEPYNKGKIARYYLGEVLSKKVVLGINPELGHPEHHEYRWVTLAEAETLMVPRLLQVLKWATQKLQSFPKEDR